MRSQTRATTILRRAKQPQGDGSSIPGHLGGIAAYRGARAVARRPAGRPADARPAVFEPPPLAGRPTSYKLHEACVEMSGFWTPAGSKDLRGRLSKHTRAATFRGPTRGLHLYKPSISAGMSGNQAPISQCPLRSAAK